MNRLLFPLTVLLLLVCLGGCRPTHGGAHPSGAVVLGDPAGTAAITGTITYLPLEGGFWAVRGTREGNSETETFEPLNLPEPFREEGLQVSLQAKILQDRISFRQVGPVIEIRSIAPR